MDSLFSYHKTVYGFIGCYTNLSRNQETTDRLILASLWFSSILLVTPHHSSWAVVPHEEICNRRTDIFSQDFQKIYGIIMALLGLVVPVSIMIICLYKMRVIMYHNALETRDVARLRHRERFLRLLTVLVLAFCFSWVPWTIYWVIRVSYNFSTDIATEYHLGRCRKILILPCLMAGILSPLGYGCSSTEFRNAILRSICIFSTKQNEKRGNRTYSNNNKENEETDARRERGNTMDSSLDLTQDTLKEDDDHK